ncbi:MAG: hypothetical protein KF744_08090 [Taibaiella sp.]|nr:hypothetical protein [Taibaiella sp.]
MYQGNDIEVIDCWLITNVGVIAELRHQLSGLADGVVLRSPESGKEWCVKYRILHNHTGERQKKFPGESTNYMWPAFSSFTQMEHSAEAILKREEQNIYEYLIEGIGHLSKPENGEVLSLQTA